MSFRIYFFIFTFLFSFNVGANERWAIDCESGIGNILFKNKDEAEMIVNSNQIVVGAAVVRNDNSLSFFLEEPLDLGRGGMMLDWDEFSKKNAIADAVISGDKMKLSWKGFFEKNTSKYMWKADSDFSALSDKNDIVINKCE